MLRVLESRKTLWVFSRKFTIDLTVKNNAFTYPFADAIYMDPSFRPLIETSAGWRRITSLGVLAHELGHSVFGTKDIGLGNMMNIEMNENPIMEQLGHPARVRYYGYE